MVSSTRDSAGNVVNVHWSASRLRLRVNVGNVAVTDDVSVRRSSKGVAECLTVINKILFFLKEMERGDWVVSS